MPLLTELGQASTGRATCEVLYGCDIVGRVSARQLAPFLKVTAAKGAVCEVEMLPPGAASSKARLADESDD